MLPNDRRVIISQWFHDTGLGFLQILLSGVTAHEDERNVVVCDRPLPTTHVGTTVNEETPQRLQCVENIISRVSLLVILHRLLTGSSIAILT